MSKNSYLVISFEENGKFYAIAKKWNNSNNLVSLFSEKKVLTANICDSKKEAEIIADAWNNQYKENGNYAFSA